MTTELDEERYDQKMEAIQERVDAAYPEGLVEFSVFPEDEDGYPIDVLDDVAVEGPVLFTVAHDPFFGSGKDFVSSPRQSPTWLDVVAIANDAVQCTGDEHHIYLEGVTDSGEAIEGYRVFSLDFGS